MNTLLFFRDKAVEKRYYQELTPYLQTILHITIYSFLLKRVLYTIAVMAFDFQKFMQSWITTSLITLFYAIAIVILYLVKKKLDYLLKKWCCQHPKYVTWIIDCCTIAVCYFTVFKFIGLEVQTEYGPIDYFFQGWTWFFQTYYSVFVMFNWLPRAMYFMVFLIVATVTNLDTQTAWGKILVANMVLNCLMALAIYFSAEKSNRELFLKREYALQRSEVWKKMVNEFPEGFALVSKQGKIIFSNKSLDSSLQPDITADASNTNTNLNFHGNESSMFEYQKLSKFENLTVGFSDERLKFPIAEEAGSHIADCEGKSFYKGQSNLQDEDDQSQAPIQEYRKNLAVFLDRLLEHWKELTKTKQAQPLPNDQHLVLLDSQVNTGTMQKSFQVKIWFTLFEGEQVLVLLFSETTQIKLIHSLQDRDVYRSRLLASVSHELRTPLNGSTNFMERVMEDDRVPEDVKEGYVLPALRSNTLLLNIINDILDFSQVQANKLRLIFKTANIINDVKECMKLFEIQSRLKKIALKFEYPCNENFDHEFSTDHTRFKQILLNLLSNALKFTQEGHVKVTIVDASSDDDAFNRRIKVTVEDTGIGIPEAEQAKLFTEFARIENYNRGNMNPNGVGLGLMISNSLAFRLGPRYNSKGLQVTSQVGVGTAFSVILEEKFEHDNIKKELRPQKMNHPQKPNIANDSEMKPMIEKHAEVLEIGLEDISLIARVTRDNRTTGLGLIIDMCQNSEGDISVPNIPDEEIMRTQRPRSMKNRLRKERDSIISLPKCLCPEILVVDDDSFNIIAIESILQSLGRKNDRAFNGLEAIQRVEARVRNPCGPTCKFYQLIFMDCTMPVMNGFEATQIIKTKISEKQIPSTLIIACTALAEVSNGKQTLMSAMDEYCIKPVSKKKIVEFLKKTDREFDF